MAVVYSEAQLDVMLALELQAVAARVLRGGSGSRILDGYSGIPAVTMRQVWAHVADHLDPVIAHLIPVAAFSGTPLSGDEPLTVTFTDASTGSITDWLWDFGDTIGTSTEQSPVYEYPGDGVFDVTLTVTGPSGEDVLVKSAYITVNEVP
jgi:PKD repeat protein